MPSPYTLLTPEISKQVFELIAAGNRDEVAALAVGVTNRTLARWRAKGREGVEEYVEFFEGCRRASAIAEVEALKTSNAGDTKIGADRAAGARWWMSRARSIHYSESSKVTHEIEAQLSKFMTFLESELDGDTFIRVLTGWQELQRLGPADIAEAATEQEREPAKLLGAADVVDSEGKQAP